MVYYLSQNKKKCAECNKNLIEGRDKVTWLAEKGQEPLELITDLLLCTNCRRLYIKSNRKKINGEVYFVPAVEVTPKSNKGEDQARRKKGLGIYPSTSKSKRCSTCEFHSNHVCAIHLIKTNTSDLCNEYKNHYKRIVYGGSFSSK